MNEPRDPGVQELLRSSVQPFSWAFKDLIGQHMRGEEWTPVLTFATPGDLTVVYSTQAGRFVSLGQMDVWWFQVVTSTFTHATAAGNCQITGLQHMALNATGFTAIGALRWSGITKATFTDISTRIAAGSSTITLAASGSGVATAIVTSADMPTGGTVQLVGFGVYIKE